jgi:hypothetical protein
MLAAVEAWVRRDHEAEWQTWVDLLDGIARGVGDVPTVTTQVDERAGLSNRAPVLTISWDPDDLHITGEEVAEDFARKAPRIAVGSGDADGKAAIRISPNQMQPGNDDVVVERIRGILTESRRPRVTELAPATVDLSGQWQLTVHYHSSTARHRLTLAQDGNWIDGSHESDFSIQQITGVVEGDRVKLSSAASKPGDNVPFLFAGDVAEGAIEGSIHLGEYLTATFRAERAPPRRRAPIRIPGGPPLAT